MADLDFLRLVVADRNAQIARHVAAGDLPSALAVAFYTTATFARFASRASSLEEAREILSLAEQISEGQLSATRTGLPVPR